MHLFKSIFYNTLVDLFIRRKEKRLEKTFGEEWMRYKNQVCRWL